MTGKEVQAIILTMNAFWQPKIEQGVEMDLWYEKLKDLDYKTTSAAINYISDTDTYRPTPARIKSVIEEMSGTKRMGATEAWLIARPKCNRYVTREELEKLPDEIRKCIREAGGSAYLGEQPEYRAQKAFESAWNAMGDTEKREQVQRIGSDQGMKRIGG